MDGDAGLIAAAAVNPICLWCEGEFEPRKGGSPQRFCNPKHRDAFHSAGIRTPTPSRARARGLFRGVSGYARNLEQTRPSFQNEARG